MDNDLKELLNQKAEEMRLPPDIPPPILRRARRHRLLMAGTAGVVVAVVALASFVGVRAATRHHALIPANSPTPSIVVSPSPSASPVAWRGIWPAATFDEGKSLQDQVDQGNQPWLLVAQAVVTRYAEEELGWAAVNYDEWLDIANPVGPGPVRYYVYSCDPSGVLGCADPNPQQATVTVERLVRPDPTGMWFVTRVRARPFSPPLPPFTPGDVSGLPPSFIAVQRGQETLGSIVLVDTATGEVIRTIVENVDMSEGGPGGLALTDDGSTLYYDQATAACRNQIDRVPVDGGQPEVVVSDGRTPALSPNGTLLAYVVGGRPGCPGAQSLIVRDLGGGDETSWDLGYEATVGSYGVCRMDWLPDSRRLAFNLCYEEGDRLSVLDVEQDQGIALKDAPSLGSEGSYRLLGYYAPTGGLAAVKGCLSAECTETPIMVSVDPDTGQITTTLLDQAPTGISTATFDVPGTHLLYTLSEERVYGWDGSGDPVEIARGYTQAVW